MGSTRKPKCVNKRHSNEVSPPGDVDNDKRQNSKKRKIAYSLGSQWTPEEITCFYKSYRKYGTNWKKVAGSVRNRSPEMVEALFKMNRAYLSLPHGTASAAGLIAMVTDHYFNLVGSSDDQESKYGAGSSHITQKRGRSMVQPTTSKASDNHHVSNSQPVASNNDCLSLLKKLPGGNRPFPVGRRTPRYPVSFSQENDNGEINASPTRLNVNAIDDEVVHEIAIALIEVSQRGVSPQLSRTPSKRAENVISSPFRYSLRKVESKNVGTVKEFRETKEDQIFGRMREKPDLAVPKSKVSGFSMQRHRVKTVKSKEVLLEEDEPSAFAALYSLAEFSSMMPIKDDDDKVHNEDDDDDHANVLLSAESLPTNLQKGNHKYSGARKKVYKPRPISEAPSCRITKPEKNQDNKFSVTETRRKEQKEVPKIQKTTADLDIHCSGSPRKKDGDSVKLMKKRNKCPQSVLPNLLRNSENSSSTDLQKEGSDSLQMAKEIPLANWVSVPTKVRRKRKSKPVKLQAKKEMNFPDKISNVQQDQALALLDDRESNIKETLSICLSNPQLRRWCTYEWFYSAIDYPWFAQKEFGEYMNNVGLGYVTTLTRSEWGVIKNYLGQPRLFSEEFLKEEKEKLNEYRESVRKHYTEFTERWPTYLPRPLSVGQNVVAIHPKTREIHDGRVLNVDRSSYQVQFDRPELGVEYVADIDCMPLNHSQLSASSPTSLFKHPKLSSMNNNMQMEIGSAESATYHQHKVPTTLAQIRAKEADVYALTEVTHALEKKSAIIVRLRDMNDVFDNQNEGQSSLKDSELFKKQYAAVLVLLNEANKQVSSALERLRKRNQYQGGKHSSAGQTCESELHVNEIVDSSRVRAQAMVDAAVQALSSLKSHEGTTEKLKEAVNYVNDSKSSSTPAGSEVHATSESGVEAQIPSELISKCVATLLMIQRRPPSDVAEILDRAVKSLQPKSSQNIGVHTEIQQCMSIIRNQIISLST